jgi:hypothetical protein
LPQTLEYVRLFSGLFKVLHEPDEPVQAMAAALIEMCPSHVWTEMRTKRADTGDGNIPFTCDERSLLPV